MGPFLGQVYAWGNVAWAGDGGHALAIWFCIRFGCIFSRTGFRTGCPETKTLLPIGRWRGCNPGNPSRLLPGLAGGGLCRAVLFGGVRGEGLNAPHGCAGWAAAIGVAWAGAGERKGQRLSVKNSTTRTLPFSGSHRFVTTWSYEVMSLITWQNCPQYCRQPLRYAFELGECIFQYSSRGILYVPCPYEMMLLLTAWAGWPEFRQNSKTGLTSKKNDSMMIL